MKQIKHYLLALSKKQLFQEKISCILYTYYIRLDPSSLVLKWRLHSCSVCSLLGIHILHQLLLLLLSQYSPYRQPRCRWSQFPYRTNISPTGTRTERSRWWSRRARLSIRAICTWTSTAPTTRRRRRKRKRRKSASLVPIRTVIRNIYTCANLVRSAICHHVYRFVKGQPQMLIDLACGLFLATEVLSSTRSLWVPRDSWAASG